jgi:hypothetical protein
LLFNYDLPLINSIHKKKYRLKPLEFIPVLNSVLIQDWIRNRINTKGSTLIRTYSVNANTDSIICVRIVKAHKRQILQKIFVCVVEQFTAPKKYHGLRQNFPNLL